MNRLDEFLPQLIASHERVTILGVGSELCGDDAAGMHLIDLLMEDLCGNRLQLIKGGSAPENFTGEIKEFSPQVLLIAGSVFMDHAPGTVGLFSSEHEKDVQFSTRMLPLSFTLRYLEQEVGCQIFFLGIQPARIQQKEELSPQVKEGCKMLAGLFGKLLTED